MVFQWSSFSFPTHSSSPSPLPLSPSPPSFQIVTIGPAISATFLVHGIVCAGEGILLGATDLKFLSYVYAVFFCVIPAIMLSVKRKVLRGVAQGPVNTWIIFCCYNVFRCVLWTLRVRYVWSVHGGERKQMSNSPL